MVCGEGARSGARRKLSTAYRNNTAILRWLLCAELALVTGPAIAGGALPAGGQYVAGRGTITGSSSALTVNQSTNHGIINWQGFSIGAGNRVQFNNGSGATLNRVTGKNLSRIDGSLSATGSVYLINPQGVVVGPGGKVVTNGSFVASTRDVSDSAFMRGGPLSASGTSNGDVVNAGTITSATGDAILVGRAVKNTGSVSAPNGTAVMAAGNQILLQPVGGDSRIAVSGGKGDVTNAGTVKAAQAALASAGGNIYALVENNGGINATGTANVDGHVWLTAGGTAQVSGSVSAANVDGTGGTVTARAQSISVDGTVNASATKAGQNGGTVSIVATGDTAISGTVKAKGQANGKGGTIETSGHTLEIGGATVDAGEGGHWLLDPYNLTVDSSAASTIDSSLGAGTDVTLQTTATGISGPGNANASGNGDILIESALSWSSAATLTLDAYRSIAIDAPVTVSGAGGVVLKTNDNTDGITTGDYTFGAALSFTGGAASGATLEINSTPYTLLYDMAGVQNINSGLTGNYALATSLDATGLAGWTPLGTDGAGNALTSNGFDGVFDGLNHTISNLTVDIGSNSYAGLFGFVSGTLRDIGVIGGSVRGGSFAGGLAGKVKTGSVENAFSSSAVSGSNDVGGLVGHNIFGTITNAYATGSVAGNNDVGGLVGAMDSASATNAYATGSVSGNNDVGGLVGAMNSASATNAYATGFVSGSDRVGGLVGSISIGTITNGYWDTETSGLNTAIGHADSGQTATGLTTAQIQDTLSFPDGGTFDSSIWGTGAGLYPYFLWQYPAAPQAISGTAYGNSGVTLQGGTVSVFADGTKLGLASTGANGYYYTLAASGTLSGTPDILATTNTGARVDTGNALLDFNGNVSGFDIWGSTLIAPTVRTAYSDADANLASDNTALIDAADGNDAAVTSFATGIAHHGFLVSGDFTIDQALTLSNGLYVRSAGNITVADALILPGTNALTLDAPYGSVNFNAGVTVTDGGTLTFGAPCGCGDYTLADGVSIDFTGGPSAGAHLIIDGNAYTLLYDMGDDATGVQEINDSDATLQGYYALATSLDASTDPATPAAWTPIGTDGTSFGILNSGLGFTGTFAGLGHRISNLSIDMSGVSDAPVGLFGYSSGDLRDVSVTGASVKGGDGTAAGILVGDNEGTIGDAYASGDVTITGLTGSGGWTTAGGLVGHNGISGLIALSHAAGTVTVQLDSDSDPAAPPYYTSAGGLVGYNEGEVDLSDSSANITGQSQSSVGGLVGYSNGGIDQSSATGTVAASGNSAAGGLIGYSEDGEIIRSYATGGVSAGDNSTVGGLVGYNEDAEIIRSYATGNVTGGDNSAIGGLTGYNDDSIYRSYASGNVTGSDSSYIGGLAGVNDINGESEQSYATGDVSEVETSGNNAYAGGLVGQNLGGIVSSYATGGVSGSYDVGGLVGENDGLVYQSFAIGNVIGIGEGTWVGGLAGENSGGIEQSFATGSVTGDDGDYAGGLVGGNNASGVIDQTYAMGAVRVGASDPANNNLAAAGGLVGYNDGAIGESYSTGMVSSSDPSVPLGGLVGWNDTAGIISDGYWDTDTSGLAAGVDQDDGSGTVVTGVATADLQDNATLTNWDFVAAWGTGSALYPYFQWQYPTAPQAISGTVYTDLSGITPLTGATVAAISGGTLAGTGASGANGYYYVLPLPGTLNSAGILTYLAGNAVRGAMFTDDVTDALDLFYRQLGADNIYGGTTYVWTPDGNLSTALGNLTTTLGTIANSDLGLAATASSLEASAGGIAVVDPFGNDLTIDGSLTASGAIDVAAWGGNVTLAPGTNLSSEASGNAIQIYSADFINNAGSSALSLTGGGRWLIYSNSPADDVFGDLDSGNTAVWDVTTSPTIPVPTVSVTQDGNRYLFAYQPTLTITTTNLTKTYGDDATADVANAYAASGFEMGVSGAFLGDNAASVYSGVPSVISTGAAPVADVSGGPYEIDASLGGLTLLNGYAVNFANTGLLTVNKASLLVAANNDSKTYNGLAYNGGNGVSYSGFVNGQDGSVLLGAPIYGGSAQGAVNAGLYTITVSGLASTNYAISYAPGTLILNKAPLLVTANNDSKTYDGLAYSGGNGVSYSGFVNGETASILSGTLAYGGTAQGAVNAGSYTLIASGLTSGNYIITYDPGTLAVAARPITMTANDLSRIYGAPNPTLTYAIGGDGLVNGDTLTGTLGTAANVASGVGNYAIVQGTLVASENYALTFVPGTLTINPAALSITANNVTTPTLSAAQFSARYAGFLNGDNSSVVSGLKYGLFPVTGNALNYDIVPFGATASNYTITLFPGLLTLVPQQPGGIPAPLIGDNGYNSSSSFGVSFGTNSFAFSNVATASLGMGGEILLFEAGLPGIISPFQAIAISDYSNATNSEDQLINCQSSGQNGQGTCGANGGTGL